MQPKKREEEEGVISALVEKPISVIDLCFNF